MQIYIVFSCNHTTKYAASPKPARAIILENGLGLYPEPVVQDEAVFIEELIFGSAGIRVEMKSDRMQQTLTSNS